MGGHHGSPDRARDPLSLRVDHTGLDGPKSDSVEGTYAILQN